MRYGPQRVNVHVHVYRQHPTTLKEVLYAIVSDLSPRGEDKLEINIRQRHLLKDALCEGNKPRGGF